MKCPSRDRLIDEPAVSKLLWLIPAAILSSAAVISAILLQGPVAANNDAPEVAVMQPEQTIDVVLKKSGEEFLLADGDKYCCWCDTAIFDVKSGSVVVTDFTVASDNPNVCEVMIEGGKLLIFSKDSGEATVTVSCGEAASEFIWIVDSLYAADDNYNITSQVEAGIVESSDTSEMQTGGSGNETENASDSASTSSAYKDDSGSCGDKLTYKFDSVGGTLTISGSGNMSDYSTLGTAPWWEYLDGVKKIVVEEGVTSLSNQAFFGMVNASSVSLPSSLTDIGWNALRKLKNVTSITIPKNVKSIAGWGQTFAECSKLQAILVADGNKYFKSLDGVLFDAGLSTMISYPSGKRNTSYRIPDSVKTISGMLFVGNSYIESITIPVSVSKIDGPYVINECPKCKKVYYEGTKTQYEAIEKLYGSNPSSAYTFPSSVQLICTDASGQTNSSSAGDNTLTEPSFKSKKLMFQWIGDLYDGRNIDMDNINKRILHNGRLSHHIKVGLVDVAGNFVPIDAGSLRSSDSDILSVEYDSSNDAYIIHMKTLGSVKLTYTLTYGDGSVYNDSYTYTMSSYLDD